MNEFFRRLHYLWNRRRMDRELAADLDFHREMAARHDGIPLGNSLRIREEARDAWGWTWIERLFQDLRYATRLLRKSPGFTLAAILTLAIGTGVNIAAFGFFDFMVLRPLNVRNPENLFRFHRRASNAYSFVLPYPEAAFFREYSKTLSAVLTLNFTSLSIEGEPRAIRTHFVSANWFSELGAQPALGRMFDPARDEAPGAEPVAVLGYGFWRRHFGADPSIVGKSVRLNGKPATVIGVASPAFTGLSLEAPELWVPITRQPWFAEGSHLLTDTSGDSSGVETWGRLAPNFSPAAAGQELRSLAAQLRLLHPRDIWQDERIPAEPSGYAESLLIGGRRGTGSEERDNIYPVAAMVGALTLLILAVACGNLGSLLLARSVARDREIGIRISIGAGRARLIRQLFTESLLLGLLGSTAGLGFGYIVLRALTVATGSPAWLNPAPDWRIASFSLGIGFAAAILFGLSPARQAARRQRRATAMRQLLIGAQIAASCVLLIIASLLVRALNHAASPQPGFEYQHVLSVDPGLGAHGYSPARAQTYFETLASRLRGLPGVESVSLTTTIPFGNRTVTMGIEADGRVLEAQINRIDSRFFGAMKIPLLRGRNLDDGNAHAVIVSQALAARLWPAQDPLGQPFQFGHEGAGEPKYIVVGVAASAHMIKIQDPDVAEVYYPLEPDDMPSAVALVRTSGPTEGIVAAAASLTKTIDPKVFPTIQLLPELLRNQLRNVQYGAMAVGVLGSSALLLACLGIMGVVGYAVAQRTREIGIRMALGAKPSNVVSAVLWQFASPVVLGLLAGIGGAAALSQILRRVLYGISGLDPIAYACAVGLFAVTVLLAALAPARRALKVDPMKALRCD